MVSESLFTKGVFIIFDILLVFIIIAPLLFWGWVRIVKFSKGKTCVKNIVKSWREIDRMTKVLFIISLLLAFIFLVFPRIFYSQGKMEAATWILLFLPPALFFNWVFSESFRNKFTKNWRYFLWGFFLTGLAGSLLVFWGVFIEPNKIVHRSQQIETSSDELFKDVEIVFVSDIHMSKLVARSRLEELISDLNSYASLSKNRNKRLILLFGGDFISGKFEQASMLSPLSDLNSKYEPYAVLGNHDFDLTRIEGGIEYSMNLERDWNEKKGNLLGDEVTRILSRAGIIVLRNQKVVITDGDKKLIIGGIDDIWSKTSDLTKTVVGVKDSDYFILLAHNPDVVFDLDADIDYFERVDLVLSGHTHGGEIRLPAILGFSDDGLPLFFLPTLLGQEYDQGHFIYSGNNGDIPLYITSGIGQSGTRARLFNPPEIVIFSFK